MELIGAFLVIAAFSAIVAGFVTAVWKLEKWREGDSSPDARFWKHPTV